MEKADIKITIDANGNIQRDIVEREQPEVRKQRFLKKIVSSLSISAVHNNR